MLRAKLAILLAVVASTPSWSQPLPPPTAESRPCTNDQEAAALVVLGVEQRPLQCYSLHRFSFHGVALVLAPDPGLQNVRDSAAFSELRREVRETQFQRLQREREPSARSADGQVAHMTIPRTLSLLAPSPIGVFHESDSAIATLDLLPIQRRHDDSVPKKAFHPMARADVVHLGGEHAMRLVLFSMTEGVATIRDIYRLTEHWLERIDEAKRTSIQSPAR
jgi:hypothetical protein